MTVDELSGVTYDPGRGTFWAVADSGGRLLEIDVDFDCDGSILSASAVSAITLVDDLDFEGLVLFDPNSVYISDEGTHTLTEYSLLDGTFLDEIVMPAIFSNARSNLSLEALGRRADGSQTITGVEQALTVDGPDGTSTTIPTVSRWQLFDAGLGFDGQVAYRLEPAHDGSVGGGSALPDLSFLADGRILTLERSQAAGEFLVRIFQADLSAATDVSQPPLDDGIDPNEPYVPVAKRLMLSDDRLGKLEDIAAGAEACGEPVLLGVVDGGTNTLHSFIPLPEPGALLQLAAGALGLLGLRGLRGGRTAGAGRTPGAHRKGRR